MFHSYCEVHKVFFSIPCMRYIYFLISILIGCLLILIKTYICHVVKEISVFQRFATK